MVRSCLDLPGALVRVGPRVHSILEWTDRSGFGEDLDLFCHHLIELHDLGFGLWRMFSSLPVSLHACPLLSPNPFVSLWEWGRAGGSWR